MKAQRALSPKRALATCLTAFVAAGGLTTAAAAATAVPASAAAIGGVSHAAAKLLDLSLKGARGEAGVDWTGKTSKAGTTVTLTTEAGLHDGKQQVNFTMGKQQGHISIILVGTTVYIDGDAFGLEQYLGFESSAAQKEAGHWLSIAEPDATLVTIFQTVAAGLTVNTTVSELDMSGPLSETAVQKISGTHAVGVRGTTLATSEAPPTPQVLYVKATGEHLPVEAVQHLKDETSSEVLGPWGKPPSVHAPKGAVPFQVTWLSGQ